MAARVKTLSRSFVWIIMALLVVGLAGFGATNLSGTQRTVAQVGDEIVDVDEFAREFQREMRAFEAQTGAPLPIQQARDMGLDRVVINRLVSLAALDNEAAGLGLSVGDTRLQQEIMRIPAFQGVSGKFDREAYKFALSQANLKEATFERDLRNESARALIQGALTSGVRMPEAMTDTLVNYIAARRSFTWALLDESALDSPIAEPAEDVLRAHYDAFPDRFMLPETRKLTYVLLTPDMILDQVTVDDTAIQTLYDKNRDEYEQPERRLIERLVFADDDSAASAKAQLEVGGTTFESLVEGRGLALSDVDLGDVAADDLGNAADAVFAAEVGDVVGPLPSNLGPALFRINGKLAARITTLDDVGDELRDELAGDMARRQIESRVQEFENLLAGGARLEELAEKAGLKLDTMDWTPDSSETVAGYAAFNEAAARTEIGAYPSIQFLDDGGIFALRVDEILPPRAEPFDSAQTRVAADWAREQARAALQAKADRLVADLATNGDFAAAGLDVKTETGLMRTAYIDGTPQDFLEQVFEMEPGDLRVISFDAGYALVRLDKVLSPETGEDITTMRNAIAERQSQSLAQALFNAYAQDARLRARPRVDDSVLAAVLGSFR